MDISPYKCFIFEFPECRISFTSNIFHFRALWFIILLFSRLRLTLFRSRIMDALGIKIEPTAGDATNSGVEQVFSFIWKLYGRHYKIFFSFLGQANCWWGWLLHKISKTEETNWILWCPRRIYQGNGSPDGRPGPKNCVQTVRPVRETIKDEMRNLRKEYLHAQEEVKRIQSIPLVIGQFLEAIDQFTAIVGSTTGSNYYVR